MAAATTLRKIGNSQGVTIPKLLCEQAGLSIGSDVTLSFADGKIVVTPAAYDTSTRIGLAKGKRLVSDEWHGRALDDEIARELMEAL